ncbi:MAG: ZIP family metal transporter [Adhaeribacter sp.]
MLVAIVVLFFTVILSGWLVKLFPQRKQYWLKIILAFSGAYLFTLTIIHILPDVLLSAGDPHEVGYYVLAGFFLQLVLEIFSQGIEHGHMHLHAEDQRSGTVPFLLLLSLIIHSFLEGSILVQNQDVAPHLHVRDNFYEVLAGIAIHHIPAAFALMSILVFRLNNFRKAFAYLLLFAVASPLGILFSNYIIPEQIEEGRVFIVLSGLVAGNFLHISTTILFETSPEHRFNRNKVLATLAGALLALAGDLVH